MHQPTITEVSQKLTLKSSISEGAYSLYYDKAIELDPNFAPAYHDRGVAKAQLKQYSAAIADLDKAIG